MQQRLDPEIEAIGAASRRAAQILATVRGETKRAVLEDLAKRLEADQDRIIKASQEDVTRAESQGLSGARLKRLSLGSSGITQMCQGVREIAAMPEPIGAVTMSRELASGLRVTKVRSPLGVIAMIYESRPGVTVDAFALCFKSGNACILKGGREASGCTGLLGGIIKEVLASHGLPAACITTLADLERERLVGLLSMDRYIDLAIPRGGPELITFVKEHAKMPTIEHYRGVCHIYVDASADLSMALKVCTTAKTSAPATCNAAECILVDDRIAKEFVPMLVGAFESLGVQVRGCELTRQISPRVVSATEDDWGREYLDLVIAMRVVKGVDEALAHIERYTSNHTEAILARDEATIQTFTRRVQSSCTVVNASTRFNDGFSLGLGAEIGISTSKLHAYGPMGLEELTTQRYVVYGDGHTR